MINTPSLFIFIQMSKKDIMIIILSIIIGFGIGLLIVKSRTKEIVVEKVVEVKETKTIDSLNRVIKVNEEIIESLKDSVREKIVYVEKRIDEIKELPIDDNITLLRDNLLVYGDNFDINDTLPSLCQINDSKDTLVLMSEDNLTDINVIIAKYEGTIAITNYYLSTIEADEEIISLKDSIIVQKDNIIDRERENFESNMKDLEKIIEKERRKQIYYTIGGIITAGTITYLIFRK